MSRTRRNVDVDDEPLAYGTLARSKYRGKACIIAGSLRA